MYAYGAFFAWAFSRLRMPQVEAVLAFLDSIGVRGADASKVRPRLVLAATAWHLPVQMGLDLRQGAWSVDSWCMHGARYICCLRCMEAVTYDGPRKLCLRYAESYGVDVDVKVRHRHFGGYLCLSSDWGACAGAQVVKKFPEVTACSIEERLKENMTKLERDWKIKGPTAANVIKRQPQARRTGQIAMWGVLVDDVMLYAQSGNFRALTHCLSYPSEPWIGCVARKVGVGMGYLYMACSRSSNICFWLSCRCWAT